MTPAQMRAAVAKRYAETYEADERAIAEVRAKLPAAVDAIVERLGDRRVVLFGSLATGLFRDASSDVDLAIDGVGVEAPRALVEALAAVLGRRVDVVDPECVGYAIRRAIARGEVLHEPRRQG